jgi:hypothetical protein
MTPLLLRPAKKVSAYDSHAVKSGEPSANVLKESLVDAHAREMQRE